MAEQTSEQDRNEPASPFKLEEARKKGQVAKSTEVNSAVALLAGLLVAMAFSTWAIRQVLVLCRGLFEHADLWIFDGPNVIAQLATVGARGLFILSPLLALTVIGAVLSNVLQTGPVFSTQPLKPDFQRLNPAAGFKRLFSKRALFEAFKTLFKLTLYSTIAYMVLRGIVPELLSLYRHAPSSYPQLFVRYGNRLLFDLLIGVVAIALIDLIFTRWEFLQRMRMSRKEMRDEVKRREGDPQIRNRRRELQREMRRRTASMSKVKDADVLVTNPEHYAVALQYRRDEMPAPMVIAKGAGPLAQKMRDAAFASNVPIIPNRRLARGLYDRVPIGASIPEEHYEAVATILKWVYELRMKQTKSQEKDK